MGKWALISGASSGIGREFARVVVADGYNVIITARREDRLRALEKELSSKGCKVHVITCDLATPHAAEKIYQEIKNHGYVVELLINNAGFGDCNLFQNAEYDKLLRMVQVNISSLLALTYMCIPNMRTLPYAGILNIGSVAGFQPGPYMAIYYATKAFVLSFTEALAQELRNSSIHVSVLCPGPTQSEFGITAGAQSSLIFQEKMLADAYAVALYGYKALKKRKPVAIYGIFFKLLIFFQRILPRRMVVALTARIQKKRSTHR